TAMTLRALGTQVTNVDDLDGRLVATTAGSTASAFLRGRDISHETFVDYTTLLHAFEDGELDAVFFDTPLLAYYAATEGRGVGRVVERVFRPEDYGIALPQGSDLRERINVALLNVQEAGVYEDLYWRWFETGR
ncbi:MAG: transporter substrate-binding domain-containing protein, partial [Pseudomonadota bacterium]